MSYQSVEKETVIRSDDECKTWSVYTLQGRIITKLRRLGIEPLRVDPDGAHHYEGLSFSQVSFRQVSKRPPMSEEQRAAAAERFAEARKKKGDSNE